MASEENCFTFLWKLENVRLCLPQNGALHAMSMMQCDSPCFVVESIAETKWYLSIFPRGVGYSNDIGLDLYRWKDKGPDRVLITFDLALLAADNSILTKSLKITEYFYIKEDERPCRIKEKFFIVKLPMIFQRNTLVARCRIWKRDEEITENIRCWAYSQIRAEKISFLWNIKNFSSMKPGDKYTYNVKSLAHDKQLMTINLSLAEERFREIIDFELVHKDRTIKFVTLLLSLVDAFKNRIECNHEEFDCNSFSISHFKFFFTKKMLMKRKSSYLPNDVLSLHWEWVFSEGSCSEQKVDADSVSTSQEIKLNPQRDTNQQLMPLSYPLNDNLKSLCDEGFLCDVKLKTSTNMFQAHKIVLSASSSVFKAMFSNDMKEKDSGCVNIVDLSDTTMNQMLIYMYTTRTGPLTWESAIELYVAADKYDIFSLKSICSSYIKDNLSQINACEILLLSEFHADGDLKSCVQSYILKYAKNIVNSGEWKRLMKKNPTLAAETLCLQYK